MLCSKCGFDNPKDINICSMCGSSMGILVNKLNLNKEAEPETEKIPDSFHVVHSESAKATSFPMKTIAVLFITIVIATGGFYGYQLFHQELLKEENARKDAEIKSSTAQREAEEAAKQASEIRANAILEKEKFATELAKQQAALEVKNLNDGSDRILSEARSTQEEENQKNTPSVKMAIDGYFSSLNEGNIEKSINYWNYPSDKIKKIIEQQLRVVQNML